MYGVNRMQVKLYEALREEAHMEPKPRALPCVQTYSRFYVQLANATNRLLCRWRACALVRSGSGGLLYPPGAVVVLDQ